MRKQAIFIAVLFAALCSPNPIHAAERLTLRDCIDTALRSQPMFRDALGGI